ncbi:hypothetical protein, partial [Lactococcus petauri]|uniref:hypothetical protein n=1 Tax=Lactococcus petauri TaxID=1940789 RepID=UPI00254DEB88
PVLPVIGMLGALFIMWTTITQQPVLAMIGIAITLAGIPVFYYLCFNGLGWEFSLHLYGSRFL